MDYVLTRGQSISHVGIDLIPLYNTLSLAEACMSASSGLNMPGFVKNASSAERMPKPPCP